MNSLRITIVKSNWAMERWYIAKGVNRDPVRKREADDLIENLSLERIGTVFNWVHVNARSSKSAGALDPLSLSREPKDFVNIVNTRDDLLRLIPQTDLFVVMEYANDVVLNAIEDSARPCLLAWNEWGWDYDSRYVRDVLLGHENLHVPHLFGKEDLTVAFHAARGIKRLRETKVVCVDKWPSGTVKSGMDVEKMADILGFEIVFIPSSEYIKANDECTNRDLVRALSDIGSRFKIELDSSHAKTMARNYLAIRKLVDKYDANCFAIDCLSNPDIDYSPCAAFALLEDEGVIYACEADLTSLVPHLLMHGMSGASGFLGNFNMIHIKHVEIVDNIIEIEHDVLPPSWCSSSCRILDHHGSKKGSTLSGDIQIKDVTVSGLSRDGNALHAFTGEIVDVKNLVHCRTGLWIKSDQPIRDVLCNIVGHHQIVMPGKWLRELATAVKWLGKMPLIDKQFLDAN